MTDDLSLRPAFDTYDADVAAMATMAHAVHVAPPLKGYIVDLAAASRRHPSLALGVSPRAALGLLRAARARASRFGPGATSTRAGVRMAASASGKATA